MPSSYELPFQLHRGLADEAWKGGVVRNFDHLVGILAAQGRTIASLQQQLADGGAKQEQLDRQKQGNEGSDGSQLGDDESLWGVGVDAGILAVIKTSNVATTIPAAGGYDLYDAVIAPNTYTFEVDRPLNVFMVGYGIVANTDAAGHAVRMVLRVTDPGAVTYDGDPSATFLTADSNKRQVVNIRTFTAYTPGSYKVQWGFQSDGIAYSALVGDRKLLMFLSYAPAATGQGVPGDPNWTADPANIAGYGLNT